jgi:hypothetical protein
MDLKDHLTKAYEQKSTDSDVLNQLMAVAIIESDTVRAKMLFNQLMENNILGQAFIDYGSDVLVSAPAHSTLITHSFSDSYGVFYNQFSNSLRPDVTVINLDFCQSDYYRTQLQKKGYNIPPKTVIDTSFFSDFIGRNSDKIFAISLTVPKNYILSSPIELYTNGLVFSNKTEFESNVDLFEKKLNKKVLYQSSKTSKNLAFNYIPILLEIRKKYSEQGQIEKEREVDKLIDSIANSSNRENQINKMKNNN